MDRPLRNQRELRRRFGAELLNELRLVWPILSGLLGLIMGLGGVAGLFEGWSLQESLYFSLVTGLTIGYGDFSPKTLVGRGLAIGIGICGILMTGLVAAVAVKALTDAQGRDEE